MDCLEKQTKDSVGKKSSSVTEHRVPDGSDDLLKPVSINTNMDLDGAVKKYSEDRASESSSKASTLKGEDSKSSGSGLPAIVHHVRKSVAAPTQQAAEYPELEGIERMNPALSNTVNNPHQREVLERQPDREQEADIFPDTGQHQYNASLIEALSALGGRVDRGTMERSAKKAVDEKHTEQSVASPGEEQAPLSQSQLADRSLDSLSNRVDLLLSETVAKGTMNDREKSTVGSSSSSRRSSQTSGSINYDMLQRELDDIQSGLVSLQSGDLSIKYVIVCVCVFFFFFLILCSSELSSGI